MKTNLENQKYIKALQDIKILYTKLLKENRIYHNSKHGVTIFEIAEKTLKN